MPFTYQSPQKLFALLHIPLFKAQMFSTLQIQFSFSSTLLRKSKMLPDRNTAAQNAACLLKLLCIKTKSDHFLDD